MFLDALAREQRGIARQPKTLRDLFDLNESKIEHCGASCEPRIRKAPARLRWCVLRRHGADPPHELPVYRAPCAPARYNDASLYRSAARLGSKLSQAFKSFDH